jgi:cellulose synthase/poly-beta-1,6-N-acetylglucosamine synthase-like glycosyltransferase
MMVLFYLFAFIMAIYAVLVMIALYYWRKQPEEVTLLVDPQLKLSVILPARNEEQNIRNCLESLCSQNYPKELFEIILIDDHSTDQTHAIAEKFSKRCSNLTVIKAQSVISSSPKKDAITQGIAIAKGDIIVTTDADVIASSYWLESIAAFHKRNNFKMICAPVLIGAERGFLEKFQQVEMLALMGFTAASIYLRHPLMCNGANLAYEKKAFYEAGGFNGINSNASGDDVLLMLKFKKIFGPESIGFLKNKSGIVKTNPVKGIRNFIVQRVRWSTKTGISPDAPVLFTSLIAFLASFSLLTALVVSFFSIKFAALTAILFIVKTLIDLAFINSVSCFFGQKIGLGIVFLGQLLNIVYVPFVAFISRFSSYSWKGRRLS